jgi:membrane dipeptidase
MKKMTFLLFLLCPALPLLAQSLSTRLDSLVGSEAADGSFNGSALVAWHDKILLDKGYGFRNVRDKTPNDPQTIFQIASITKQFTAVVVLRLAEENKIALTDPLNKYYPQFPQADRITIFNLLTHTSGITDHYDSTAKPFTLPPSATHEQSFIASASAKKLAFTPGTKREYSNSGYILLGYIVEKITGMTYFEAVKHFIFEPLHMDRSSFDLSKVSSADKATGYEVFTANEKKEGPPIDPYGPFAAGAICSTVEDLYKWHQALQAYRVVSKASLEMAYTPFIDKYGFGWHIDSLEGKRVVSHDGGITGFNSNLSRIPGDDVFIILLNNKPGHNLFRMTREIYDLLYNLPARSKKIHDAAIVVDTHNDVLSNVTLKGLNIETDLTGKACTDLGRLQQAGVKVQIFSIFCDDRYGKGTAYKYANREIDSLYAIAGRNPDKMRIVYNLAELLAAVKAHRLAAMMGVEGGHMMEDDTAKLDSFYQRGVRYLTLTWNNSTSWASSALDETQQNPLGRPYGLSPYGKQVVRHMNRLGMIVDLSHAGEKSFYDAIAVSAKPVICSHSSVYALCPVFRNLKDEQIRAIAKNGGVIQVNFYSGFIDSNYSKRLTAFMGQHKRQYDSLTNVKTPYYAIMDFFAKAYPEEAQSLRPSLSKLVDHIDYIVKLVGLDYVGLGSDFDGSESTPLGLDGVQDYPKITEELVRRGYSKEAIDKILGGNFLRVFKANQD